MKKDIILSGVGGQGILSIATVIGKAALKEGLYMKQAEVHGMSQRGGDVQSNLRISDQPIASDLIPSGKCDLIISLEPMEGLRYLPYLSPNGWLVTNETPFVNIPNYPEADKVMAEINKLPHKIVLNVDKVAKEVGSARVANIVLLGATIPFLGIDYGKVQDSIREIFLRKGEAIVEMNLKSIGCRQGNCRKANVITGIIMNTQYWEEELETMSREKLQELQLRRLKKTINIAANSPYYKEVFSKHGITADSIQSLDDIRKLPFTTKADMRAHYPFGLVAGDMSNDGVRIHSSSGTTGNPTVIVHSQHDLDSWANLVARCLYAVGIRKTDVFQNSSGYGMFTGGLGFQYGAERLGCLTVPAAAGNSKRQIKFINDFKTTALHAIPSYAIRLAEVFQEEGLDPKGTTLKTLVIGAEPHTDEQRRKIEKMLGVKAYNSFGMTEMNGPGVAFECQEQNGMHFWEDCYLVEIIDPETGEPVQEGEIGELVLTTLDREMMPLIRYRTRDLTRILPGKCPCGRTHIRIDRIKGRSDDMFIIKGVNIFPMQVEKILVQFPELGSNYLITLETVNNQDEMIVEVELSDLSTDNYIELEKIRKDITRQLKDEILVTPKVKLVKKGSLPQSEGKAVRVKDLRDNK